MTLTGELPDDTVVGRWWKDEVAEIDVLALTAQGPILIGECRWQMKSFTERDLTELRRKAAYLPTSQDNTQYAFWSRGSADATLTRHPDTRVFTPKDILGE